VRIPCKLSLFLFLTMPVSWAQEAETDSVEQIVVTATRSESALRDVGRSISLVHKDRIQNATQQLGLDEVLNGIPGLYMQNRYNFSQDLRVALLDTSGFTTHPGKEYRQHWSRFIPASSLQIRRILSQYLVMLTQIFA